MLQSNLGILLSEYEYVILVDKNTSVPFDSCYDINLYKNKEFSLFQGNSFIMKNNKIIRTYNLENCKDGFFTLHLIIDENYKISLKINDCILENNLFIDNDKIFYEDKEPDKKDLYYSKHKFKEYIFNQKNLLSNDFIKTKLKEYYIPIKDILEQGEKILQYTDITSEEYESSLKELQFNIDPILKKYLRTNEVIP